MINILASLFCVSTVTSISIYQMLVGFDSVPEYYIMTDKQDVMMIPKDCFVIEGVIGCSASMTEDFKGSEDRVWCFCNVCARYR